jgi:ATP-binding cassette subfamily F protein 3
MSLLQIDRLSKSFGTHVLFEPFSAQISRGERIALIGDNGAGKSTLLRMIAGTEESTGGDTRAIGEVRIGHLPQTARLEGDGSIWEAVERAFSEDRAIERELRHLEIAIADGADDERVHRYDDLLHRFADRGGYEIEAKTRAALAGVGFAESEHDKPVDLLSGGEEARAALARVLLESPDALLLDEPTNHLDFAALDWLEEQLLRFPGALVLVSHDRHLLERVSNRTWEIAFGQVSIYRVGYGPSRTLRNAERQRQLGLYEKQEETIDRYRDFVRRHKAGQKHRQAKDRERKLERIEKERIEEPKEAKRIGLRIPIGQPSGKRVLALQELEIGFDEPLFSCPNLNLHRGEKVAIIGPNGCGKTTLLRTITGEQGPLRGDVELGHNAHTAVYSQTQEGLRGPSTVLDAILARAPLTISEARGLLGRFLFTGTDVMKKTQALSGGERSRVALALLSLIEGNLLLLDEPTNHLDLASQEILERALIDYEGTVLLVSHDRALLEAITTQVWWIEKGRMNVHTYGYAELRRRMLEGQRSEDSETGAPTEPQLRSRRTRGTAVRAEVSRARHDREAIRVVEEAIEELEAQIERIEADLVEASEAADGDRIAGLGAEHAELRKAVMRKYDEWHAAIAHAEAEAEEDRG